MLQLSEALRNIQIKGWHKSVLSEEVNIHLSKESLIVKKENMSHHTYQVLWEEIRDDQTLLYTNLTSAYVMLTACFRN